MTNSIKLIITFLLFFHSVSTAQIKHVIELKTENKSLPFGLTDQAPVYQPILGLALSGGGARGLAQIGVLKALEEAGIEIHNIAGTSMGSIIGGLYAAGYCAKEIDSIATNTNWDELLSLNETASRRELFIDQKITEDRAIFTIRLDGFKPVIPTAFNEGLRLTNYLTLLTLKAPVLEYNSFDDLLIKYRAVCTDLVSGNPVYLKNGTLSRAMRASSSVSFFLSPVQWDSLTLVDGGLVSNVPVEAVKMLGTDVIIAVNTTSPLRKEEELDLPWNIADQTVSIPMKLLDKEQLSSADVIIEPPLIKSTAIDFNDVDSLICEGYNAALNHIDEIKNKLDTAFKNKIDEKEYFFKKLKISDGFTEKEKNYFYSYLIKDSVSNKDLYLILYKLYSTGKYKKLKFEITDSAGFPVIKPLRVLNPQIKKIQVTDNGIGDSTLKSKVENMLLNKYYNPKNLLNGIFTALMHYKDKGYLLTKLIKQEFDEESGELILEFNAGVVSDVIIYSKTNRLLLSRELNIHPGDNFLYDNVKKGLKNIRSTNLFEDINLSVINNNDEIIISVYVKEKVSRLMKVGFLVDNVYNAQLSLDLRDVNLFNSGTELGLFLFGGASNRAYILEHTAYRVFSTYLTYKINLYYKFNDIDVFQRNLSSTGNTFNSDKIGEYRQIFYGASVSLGSQIEKFGKLIFTGKYQLDEIKNKIGSTVTPYKTKIVSLRIGATIDNQNKYPYPEDGLYFDGFYETAQSFLGGDESFLMVGIDFNYFFKLGSRSIIKPRIKLGFADKTLPLSEQFTLGGQHTFFGLHENELRGRQVFLASLMYQFKIPFKIFFDTYLWFRYDVGATWEEQEQIRYKDLKHGLGATLSFDTPIGPADFSIGRSFLLRKDLPENPLSWGDVLFYFSIGHAIKF